MTEKPVQKSPYADISPALAEITDNVLFGDVWKRPGLSPRDRSLVTVASLVSLYRTNELPFHLKRALENGVTREELAEVITHLAFYAGWPPASTAVGIARKVFEEAGGLEPTKLGKNLHRPPDVRFEEGPKPKNLKPPDAIISLSMSCVCGSDLWPYRGLNEIKQPMAMGHEYCGVVSEIGSTVKTIKPGQFVVGSFCLSDNTCPNCRFGFQSSCEQREFMMGAQAP